MYCKYISINNSRLPKYHWRTSMQRPAGYYLITILSLFLWFNFLLLSVTYLSHHWFYKPQKIKSVSQCSCQNICNYSHVSSHPTHSSQLFVKVKHASCWPYNFTIRVRQRWCAFIRALLCQNWSLDETNCKKGRSYWFPVSVLSIYGVKYIIWQWCTLISLIVESPISV